MNLVYFPEEFHQAAPAILNYFCQEPNGEWMDLVDVVKVIQTGEQITIRHATETEMKRAESFVALYQVGQELAARLDAVLDMHPPAQAEAAKAAAVDALSSEIPFPSILDAAAGG